MVIRVLPEINDIASPSAEVVASTGVKVAVSTGVDGVGPLPAAIGIARRRRDLRPSVVERMRFVAMKTGGNVLSWLSTRPWHRPSVGPEIRAELAQLLKPGDILVTRRHYAVTNYLMPGYWPHATLYLGDAASLAAMGLHEYEHVRRRWSRIASTVEDSTRDGGDPYDALRVLEARKDGVHIRPLASPMKSDAVAIVRPRLVADDIVTALARGLRHEGKPYDFNFDFARSDRLVCTEVVYRSFRGLGEIRFELRNHGRRVGLSADDLLRMALAGDGFDPVAVYLPSHSRRVCHGAEAEQVMSGSLAPSAV